MNSENFFSCISVNQYSATPKYLQVANAIVNAFKTGSINPDELLPSINNLTFNLDISRATAEKSYRHLQKTGFVDSFPGKGFQIKQAGTKPAKRIFMLFNKLSTHKKIIYDAFVSAIEEDAIVEFYNYNNDAAQFEALLSSRKDYAHYVIIPHLQQDEDLVCRLLNQIPRKKLLILDKGFDGIKGEHAKVVENFESDIYNALLQAREPLQKYHTLKIIFPEDCHLPVEILNGFERFCTNYGYAYTIVRNIQQEEINEGEVYISLMEDDLVVLIEKIILLGLQIGRQIGVISYNETPFKKIILNGITTISTDFKQMGYMAARLVNGGLCEHLEVPFHLTLRNSL